MFNPHAVLFRGNLIAAADVSRGDLIEGGIRAGIVHEKNTPGYQGSANEKEKGVH